MFGIDNSGSALDTVTHIIQVALTPVFLLSGIATLLNVFSARQAHTASEGLEGADAVKAAVLSARLAHLHRRSLALDVAVVLGAIGGAATCGAVLTLFVGALREATVASMLFGLFGLAVICALGAIVAFTVEMLMASIGIRDLVAESGRKGAGADAAEGSEPPQHADAGGNAPPSDSP